MTDDQIISICDNYIVTLEDMGHKAKSMKDGPTGSLQAIKHALWMCYQLRDNADIRSVAPKANRWLGFIQGVLWARGHYNIDEIREHNK